jgi:hypothetical protein
MLFEKSMNRSKTYFYVLQFPLITRRSVKGSKVTKKRSTQRQPQSLSTCVPEAEAEAEADSS